MTVGYLLLLFFFFFQAEDGIRDVAVTGVQTCALPISTSGTETAFEGIQPYVPLGRIGMLTRYQTLPSEPICLRTANISCGRKSDRNWCITLITCACGFGAFRTGTEWRSSSPAAGNTDSTRVCDEGDLVVGVVGVVDVVVVPVDP